MLRFQDWPFRTKLLVVSLAPVGLVALLTPIGFYVGLETVWHDAVATQAELQRLESLTREYQAEVREYVISGLPETLDEIDEIEEEIPEILDNLRSGSADRTALADELTELAEGMIRAGGELKAQARPEGEDLLSPEDIEEEIEAFEDIETLLENKISGQLRQAEVQVTTAFERFRSLLLASSFGGLGLGLILALGLARWLNGPLHVLQQASERILDGDYRPRELLAGRDELGQLAHGFDRAAEEIRDLLATKERHLETLRNNQEQLIQTGKLAAVGELAAGVAHEINNPLSAVLTYGVLLREKAEKQPPEALAGIPKLVERLKLIESAAIRCKRIADNLLTFARRDESEKGLLDLAETIDESIQLTAPLCRGREAKVSRATEGAVEITGNPNQLLQVLVNLINNAAQATESQGRIEVGARAEGDSRLLWVKDNGPGIPEELKGRIFDPFVTSKPVGEGTGLGLSIVYGIVQDHGGRIEVESGAAGTTFNIYFPGSVEPGR